MIRAALYARYSSDSFDRQKVEASVAVRCINRFTALGMPKSIRIA